jgi:CHAD domain-containing protein
MNTREIELKLSVHASYMIPDLAEHGLSFQQEELPPRTLRATYYDTEDLRLARSRATLRYRSGEAAPGWTLKLPVDGSDAHVRDEHNFPGSQTTIPERIRELVTPWARTGVLIPVARLTTRRRVWKISGSDGEPVAEIDDDEVSILEGRRVVARFREVEVESKGASLATLEDIARVLMSVGAVAAEPIPKAVRALGPKATAAPDLPEPHEADPDAPAELAIANALRRSVGRILTHDTPTRLGEPEGVHQMRVGARRLRSDLRTFASLVDTAWAEKISDGLKWLADELGHVRDIDVLKENCSALPFDVARRVLLDDLTNRHEDARASMLSALNSPRYKELLELLVDSARDPRCTPSAKKPSAKIMPPMVDATFAKLARRARKVRNEDHEESFHSIRIHAKRTRYAAEAVAAALGKAKGADAARFASLVTDVQDQLGELQDTAVARELITSVADTYTSDPRLLFELGRAYQLQEAEADRLKAAFLETWERLDRGKNLRWMQR